jgi:hypothetical protein
MLLAAAAGALLAASAGLVSCAAKAREVELPASEISIPAGSGWAPRSSFELAVETGMRGRREERRILVPMSVSAFRGTETASLRIELEPEADVIEPAPRGTSPTDLEALAKAVADAAGRQQLLDGVGSVVAERDGVVLVDGKPWASRIRFAVVAAQEIREAGRFEFGKDARSRLDVDSVRLVAERSGSVMAIPAEYLAQDGGRVAVDLRSLGVEDCRTLQAVIEGQLFWSVEATVRWQGGGGWSERRVSVDRAPVAAGDSAEVGRLLREEARARLRELGRRGEASLELAWGERSELLRGSGATVAAMTLRNAGSVPVSMIRAAVVAAIDGEEVADEAEGEFGVDCLCPGDSVELALQIQLDPCGGEGIVVARMEGFPKGTAFPQFATIEATAPVQPLPRPSVRLFQPPPDGGQTIAVILNEGADAADDLLLEVFDSREPQARFQIPLPRLASRTRSDIRRQDLAGRGDAAALAMWDRWVSGRARVQVRVGSGRLQSLGCPDAILHEPNPFDL